MKKKKGQTEAAGGETVAFPRKKRKKAPIIISAIVLILLVLRVVSCAFTPDPGVIVTTTTAVLGDLQESVSTSGLVESGETRVVFSEISGKVADVLVAAGDVVKAGDLLVSFDMEEMELRLKQAQLQQAMSDAGYQGALSENSKNQGKLTEANANIPVLEQQIADNKAYLKDLQEELSRSQRETSNALAAESLDLSQRQAELQRELETLKSADGDSPDSLGQPPETDQSRIQEIQKELQDISSAMAHNGYLQSVASSSDYVAEMQQKITETQERIAEYEEYKARMESQKSSSEAVVMDSFDRERQEADHELSKLTYEEAKRDYDAAKQGITAAFDGVVTELGVVPGATVAQSAQILTLVSSEDVKVSFQASKHDVEKLAVGQQADVVISGTTYQGEITKINHMAVTNASNTPMVGVEVQLINPDERIILGLDARLTIYTKKSENTLLIPVEAVNADKEGDFLYVAENGVVVRKPIVCGISSDTYTEVLEGITQEDQVILVSYGTLEEGAAVTVIAQ